MKIQRDITIELTTNEQLRILRKWIKKMPQVIEILQKHGHKDYDCPFPDDCKKFPCETLYCNADVCDNGHVYRMS